MIYLITVIAALKRQILDASAPETYKLEGGKNVKFKTTVKPT